MIKRFLATANFEIESPMELDTWEMDVEFENRSDIEISKDYNVIVWDLKNVIHYKYFEEFDTYIYIWLSED